MNEEKSDNNLQVFPKKQLKKKQIGRKYIFFSGEEICGFLSGEDRYQAKFLSLNDFFEKY